MYFSEEAIKQEAKVHFDGFDYAEVFEYIGINAQVEKAVQHYFDRLSRVHTEHTDSTERKLELNDKYYEEYWSPFSTRARYLVNSLMDGTELTFEEAEVLLACRAFTYATAKVNCPLQSVWRGMSEVDNDLEFMLFFRSVVDQMWG